MKSLRLIALILSTVSVFLQSCKKEITQHVVYDNITYQINPLNIYESNADKNKQKSSEQFISLLYSDLFNQTIGSDDLYNVSEVMLSFGDKGLVNTMLLENALNSPDLAVPTNDEMRADVDSFVDQTYLKFYLRHPSEYEKKYFKNLIDSDPGIAPQLVYASFAQSNEYLFY